ncbi:hypothetical protein Pan241w_03860 [Gimesia alba]|uniref:Uncharacterized protein n=1 Tax=Gimesia alba TaxID=2527973 RepID=A0A517R8W9_9PLAN|nr:hypothetical protein [Gimesia alba]QDT40330.1 hypothetical protein Pan241w_03860 [Gimesia alba]
MKDFGTGKTLSEASPFLRDSARRHALILEVVERDSVIEGLPPFTEEFRARLKKQLEAMARSETVE